MAMSYIYTRYDLQACSQPVFSAQIFIPYYTGQVIQGIAIDRDEAKFVRAIIWMVVFSAARWV